MSAPRFPIVLRILIAAALAFGVASGVAPAANADDCTAEGEGAESAIGVGMTCSIAPKGDSIVPTAHDGPDSSDSANPFVEYRWVSVCTTATASSAPANEMDCQAARICPDPRERLYRLWGRTENPDAWLPLGTGCFGEPPTAADTPRPQVTPALVLNALRRVGLPTLEARTQPEGKTLVNFATIFYTEAEPFTTTLTLLGQQVDVEATPARYTWHHGDGTSVTTSSPGAPYPSKEITHLYSDAQVTVQPSVDVTYAARFRVNGGTWQDIDETVTVAGPQGSLRVAEATAVLAGYE